MRVMSGAEVTLEANPDDVRLDKVEAWQRAGFNRISVGVQSFDDAILASLSRRHCADDAVLAVDTARAGGFDNVSIDLMFGLPAQTLATWEETLQRAVALDTDHLSLYGLQIEPGTPLRRDVQLGTVPAPDDDIAADMYEAAMERLGDAEYEHYEISNWSKPGYRSEHNLTYWRNKPYLGVGPGAHSSMMGKRFSNLKSPRGYIRKISEAVPSESAGDVSINTGELAIDFVEDTSLSMAMSETMILGLRLSQGVSKHDFAHRFETPIGTVYGSEIDDLKASGLIEERGESIRLTRRGKLLGNNVFERFIIDDDRARATIDNNHV
jgi:oxygen-independent coproporphyrinogen-3 oxidase